MKEPQWKYHCGQLEMFYRYLKHNNRTATKLGAAWREFQERVGCSWGQRAGKCGPEWNPTSGRPYGRSLSPPPSGGRKLPL